MVACSNRRSFFREILPFTIVILALLTGVGHAFQNSVADTINRHSQVLFSTNAGYEYIPPNPGASPGSFHSELRSSYPPGTPPGLRGEAVRSALVTTERCLGWNLASNPETSMGGMLEISGRGTLNFLNGKLTRDFSLQGANSFSAACLLDAKGRLVDVLRISLDSSMQKAFVLTSPGHTSADLCSRLDPFVFPMDEVELTNYCHTEQQCFSFSLAATQYKHVQKVMMEQSNLSPQEWNFPGTSQSAIWELADNVNVLIVPSTGIPKAACVGYTFVFFGQNKEAYNVGKQVWEHLIGEDNLEGPIDVGALEYETLRVEAGQPAYGHEYGIDRSKQTEITQESKLPNKKDMIKTSPLELHLNPLIDLDKGCYLGQEGVASILKNPRGPPRTLYQVLFEDDFNIYESQSRGDKSDVDNLTTLPKPGQALYALGSNEELQVGKVMSVGEAGGTGGPYTVGLCLVKRADSIRKQMKKLELEIPRDADDYFSVDAATGSGIIQPPPLDPLDGLEVIVEGTFTMGKLRAIPSRQSGIRTNSNMFDLEIEVEGSEDYYYEPATTITPITIDTATETSIETETESTDDIDEDDLDAQVAKATAEAEAAAAEAQRKAEKMESLKQRAEEAMARRKAKKAETKEEESESEDVAAAEAKRKEEKMALLQKRAEEAMARRRAKKEQQ